MSQLLEIVLFTLMLALSHSNGIPSEFENITSTEVHYYPSIDKTKVFVCQQALQIDLRDESQLLAGICTLRSAVSAGGIVNIPLNDLTQHSELVGSANQSKLTPGDWDAMKVIQKPQYFHQTPDNTKILFVDDNSCIREYNRDTTTLTTIIGHSTVACGEHTIDIDTGTKLIYGMEYDDNNKTFYLAVLNWGLYAYRRSPSGYTKQLLVDRRLISDQAVAAVHQLLLFGNHLCQKVRYGINKYNVERLPTTGQLSYDNNTFVRFISSSGNEVTDPTAWYQLKDVSIKLGTGDADLRMAPDNITLLIADNAAQRLFFLNTTDGELSALCTKDSSRAIDGDENSCTFTDIKSAVWLSPYKILVYEKKVSSFRTVQFEEPTPTTAPPPAFLEVISTTTTSTSTYKPTPTTPPPPTPTDPPTACLAGGIPCWSWAVITGMLCYATFHVTSVIVAFTCKVDNSYIKFVKKIHCYIRIEGRVGESEKETEEKAHAVGSGKKTEATKNEEHDLSKCPEGPPKEPLAMSSERETSKESKKTRRSNKGVKAPVDTSQQHTQSAGDGDAGNTKGDSDGSSRPPQIASAKADDEAASGNGGTELVSTSNEQANSKDESAGEGHDPPIKNDGNTEQDVPDNPPIRSPSNVDLHEKVENGERVQDDVDAFERGGSSRSDSGDAEKNPDGSGLKNPEQNQLMEKNIKNSPQQLDKSHNWLQP